MGGGLINIISYGAQDEYLSGEPDITFFKMVYRKHANFAMETIEQDLNISGNMAFCDIRRDGDLILNCWIECENENDEHRDGNEMLEYVQFLIGNQVIDTHYGQWYSIWNKLSMHRRNIDGYNMLINKDNINDSKKAFIPLQFFFCKNTGLALPLIALKYHEVSIHIKFKDKVKNKKLYVDYVYLEQEERIRFAQKDHEILIEQLQFSGEPDIKSSSKFLNFKHPVKELVWTYIGDAELKSNDDNNRAYNDSLIGKNISIKLNEYFKIKNREDMYFTHIQPYQHHSNIPTERNIYVYSFALKPEDYQPSGTCNFSRLKSCQIISPEGYGKGIQVYAVNYNILKITSGMGGLLFSM
jgi:hypothetical protein